MHPTFAGTAHASVARSHSRTKHCMLTRRGLPSSPALGSSPLRCHLRPGSTTPAAAGKRAKDPGNRNHAESLRRSQVMRSRTGRPHMPLSHSRHPLQAQASAFGLHAGASRSSNFHFRVWDAVLPSCDRHLDGYGEPALGITWFLSVMMAGLGGTQLL